MKINFSKIFNYRLKTYSATYIISVLIWWVRMPRKAWKRINYWRTWKIYSSSMMQNVKASLISPRINRYVLTSKYKVCDLSFLYFTWTIFFRLLNWCSKLKSSRRKICLQKMPMVGVHTGSYKGEVDNTTDLDSSKCP